MREGALDHLKKLYLKSGFIFLQDMIERGLTEEIVGEREREGGREGGRGGREGREGGEGGREG